MGGPSCPASPTEVAVLRRTETENYYTAVPYIIFTLEPQLKRLPKTYTGLRLDPHIAMLWKKAWFGILQCLYEYAHIRFSPARWTITPCRHWFPKELSAQSILQDSHLIRKTFQHQKKCIAFLPPSYVQKRKKSVYMSSEKLVFFCLVIQCPYPFGQLPPALLYSPDWLCRRQHRPLLEHRLNTEGSQRSIVSESLCVLFSNCHIPQKLIMYYKTRKLKGSDCDMAQLSTRQIAHQSTSAGHVARGLYVLREPDLLYHCW